MKKWKKYDFYDFFPKCQKNLLLHPDDKGFQYLWRLKTDRATM